MDGNKLDIDASKFKEISYKDRRQHLTYAFNQNSINGYILEFGVYKGGTINHLATLTSDIIHGFDSFKGLPEPWVWSKTRTLPPSRFKVKALPKVSSNVQLYPGWFEDTIPVWKSKNKDNIKFLHIDSDLYSSCKTILTELNDQIVFGTIIVFDELFGYACWKDGEYKALIEWMQNYDRKILPLGKTGRYAASIRVIK